MQTMGTGTPLWMAPEVRNGTIYGFPADIFSLGIVLFELFERKLPGYDMPTGGVAILSSLPSIFILQLTFPPNYQSMPVVTPCIHPNPAKRPTAQQVVDHLDGMIKHVLVTVKDHLPADEQEKIARGI